MFRSFGSVELSKASKNSPCIMPLAAIVTPLSICFLYCTKSCNKSSPSASGFLRATSLTALRPTAITSPALRSVIKLLAIQRDNSLITSS